jgi:hypothetical protein
MHARIFLSGQTFDAASDKKKQVIAFHGEN